MERLEGNMKEGKKKAEQVIPIRVPGQKTGEAYLAVYPSPGKGEKKPGVVICPGGGYWQVVEKEGEPVARAFNRMGCQAFVLHYSVLPDGFPTSLLELAKAVAILRNRAKEWDLDPERLVVCGFSAGGHLACSLGVFWNREFVWKEIGEKDGRGIRPDGMILGYPVITSGPYAHKAFVSRLFEHKGGPGPEDAKLVSLEKQVTEDTPKAFIWQTCTDADVPVENSLLLAMAMREKGVNVELHIFPDGPHGLSLATEETSGGDPCFENPHCAAWLAQAGLWLGNV